MTLDRDNNNLLAEMFDTLNTLEPDSVRQVLEILYNGVMKLERQKSLAAAPYERCSQRRGYANGYKDKGFKTRMGMLQLKVPQTRETEFYPSCLEKGCRSERALKVAIAEMYIKGVSTRKVTAVTKELCGLEVSSSQVSAMTKELDTEFEAFRNRPLGRFPYVYLDAIYLKVRHSGAVIDQSVLIAYGVNSSGRREILGLSVSLSEAEVHWRSFFEQLQSRSLHGVRLVVSDSHSGLRSALRAVFPSTPWQRCQFHMMQNALQHVPKKSMKDEVIAAMRNMFECSTQAHAIESKRLIIKQFEESAPEFASWFESNIDEGLTCLSFPQEHRRRIRTTNSLERVNREIKRRTRVATLFPNAESALRLVTGVLIEIHEEWVTGKVYLDVSRLDGV